MYFELFLITLIPIATTLIFYFLFKKTSLGKLPYIWIQIIVGVVFGGIAVFGNEFGVPVNGAQANVRDAAPLLAGLVFGAPAGIIAGTIGGVERFFAVYWHANLYLTRWACSISTILAGFYAAALRKYFFENKRPSWGLALAAAIVMEVFHFVMVFITNIDIPTEIMVIIKALALSMILANGLAVAIPILVIQIVNHQIIPKKFEKRKLSDQIKWWLLGSIALCYAITTGVVYAVQTNEAYQDASSIFETTISDVKNDVTETSTVYMTSLVKDVKEEINKNPFLPSYTHEERLALGTQYGELLTKFDIGSIDIIAKDERGTFVCSSTVGFQYWNETDFHMTDRAEGQTEPGQSELLHNKMAVEKLDVYVQEFGARSDNANPDDIIYSKYAAISLNDDYYLAICLNETQFYSLVDNRVRVITTYRHISNKGHVLIMNAKNEKVADYIDYMNQESGLSLKKLKEEGKEGERIHGKVYGQDCFYAYTTAETYTIVTILTYDDVLTERDSSFILNSFMQTICYSIIFILSYMLLDKLVVKKIEKVSFGLNEITEGNLDIKMDENSSAEFTSLSKDINSTVDTLKQFIEDAKKRIDDELAFAKTIQLNAIPSTFPAFPDKPQFSIFATMNTAKEVGGDFYDFYVIDGEHVAFLVADVSGKGIPAAMFMMEGKAIIKNTTKTGVSPNEALEKANDALAQNNDAVMFITCWFGILNFKTGHVRFANAGHNAPLIYRHDGQWEYIKQKKNIVLAAMEGITYSSQELTLNPGDRLYLYTDGVTEATRGDKVLYGEDRLQNYLNTHKDLSIEDTLHGIKDDIDVFVEGADQFDDITMLCIQYNGEK